MVIRGSKLEASVEKSVQPRNKGAGEKVNFLHLLSAHIAAFRPIEKLQPQLISRSNQAEERQKNADKKVHVEKKSTLKKSFRNLSWEGAKVISFSLSSQGQRSDQLRLCFLISLNQRGG